MNQAGLDYFNQVKPIEKFLGVLISEEHIRTLHDNEVPHIVGNSMDELMRHHPSLKEDVLSAIVRMLQKVVDIGSQVSPEDAEKAFLQTVKGTSDMAAASDDTSDAEKKDSRISQFVDVIARVSSR